ncbi:MAG TPA: serine protease [Thermoanaerobaculia bacterium]|nr:serine protease [Thermoanaerobaculia bacterium]
MRSLLVSITLLAAAVSLSARPNLRQIADVASFERETSITPYGSRKIVIEGARSIRLEIRGTRSGSRLWIGGDDATALEPFEGAEGVTWSPTVQGSTAYLVSEEPVTLSIVRAAVGTTEAQSNACLSDVACSAPEDDEEISRASRAIAMIRFVRGNASYVCTGALISDEAGSGTPYFLTAHHCISTPEEAASIEAVWDERSPACGLQPRSIRTYGAELLVSSAETDVALLRLRRIPADRTFLKIERAPLREGTPVYRLAHGDGAPMQYSAGVIRESGASCPTAPRSRFLYTAPTAGAVSKGSSGAPLLLPGLRVAGQLFGLCGASPENPCATYNEAVDGSLAASWPLLEPYLDRPEAARRRAARP